MKELFPPQCCMSDNLRNLSSLINNEYLFFSPMKLQVSWCLAEFACSWPAAGCRMGWGLLHVCSFLGWEAATAPWMTTQWCQKLRRANQSYFRLLVTTFAVDWSKTRGQAQSWGVGSTRYPQWGYNKGIAIYYIVGMKELEVIIQLLHLPQPPKELYHFPDPLLAIISCPGTVISLLIIPRTMPCISICSVRM